jgi:hypothetical protein
MGEPDFDLYVENGFFIEAKAERLFRDLTDFIATRFERY